MCAVNPMQVKAKFVEREVEIAAHVYSNDAKQGGLIVDILRLEVSVLALLCCIFFYFNILISGSHTLHALLKLLASCKLDVLVAEV
jgi:hypothetical protein